jgi:hypothetical protein
MLLVYFGAPRFARTMVVAFRRGYLVDLFADLICGARVGVVGKAYHSPRGSALRRSYNGHR